jgi:hypothetical protein
LNSHHLRASALLVLCMIGMHSKSYGQDSIETPAQQPNSSSASGSDDSSANPSASISPPPDARSSTNTACCLLQDGTPIELEIVDIINTMQIKRGDRFRIRLHAPVTVADKVLIPAGVEGVGEVVHAEPGRASGKAAELILAARTLDFQGRQIKLRGMKFSQSGSNRTGMVAGVSIGIGVFAAFIHGGNIEIPANTVVSAKIGETLQLPALATTLPSSDDTGTPANTGTGTEPALNSEATPDSPSSGTM